MTGTSIPNLPPQFFDNNGLVAAGFKLFSYAAGSSTKQNTWTDSSLATPNANPIILDSSGRAGIFLGGLSYKFVLAPPTDTDPPTSPLWTRDNIISIPQVTGNTDIPALFGTSVTAGQVVFLSDGSGGNVAGSWYVGDSTNTFSSTTAPIVGFALTTQGSGTSGTVRISGQVTGLSALSIGVSYYISTAGTLTSAAPGNARLILVADSTISGDILIASPPNASTTVAGLVSTGTQSFAGNKTFTGTVLAQGALTTNANFSYVPGASATQTPPSGVISAQSSVAGVSNIGTGETVLFTFSLPASTLNAAGKGLRITAWGTSANNANTKTVRFYFGATVTALSLLANQVSTWLATTHLFYDTNTTQNGLIQSHQAAQFSSETMLNPTETLSGAVVIKVSGQSNTASNDITCFGMLIEVLGS